jgi:hypothetical protein
MAKKFYVAVHFSKTSQQWTRNGVVGDSILLAHEEINVRNPSLPGLIRKLKRYQDFKDDYVCNLERGRVSWNRIEDEEGWQVNPEDEERHFKLGSKIYSVDYTYIIEKQLIGDVSDQEIASLAQHGFTVG